MSTADRTVLRYSNTGFPNVLIHFVSASRGRPVIDLPCRLSLRLISSQLISARGTIRGARKTRFLWHKKTSRTAQDKGNRSRAKPIQAPLRDGLAAGGIQGAHFSRQ